MSRFRKTISIVGLGSLGLPLAVAMISRGFNVIGVDRDEARLESIRGGTPYTLEPDLRELLHEHEPHLELTSDVRAAVRRSDVTFILVNTPSNLNGSFSLRQVLAVCQEVGHAIRWKRKCHHVVIASTVNPGDCDSRIRTVLETYSHQAEGTSWTLSHIPEFIALGTAIPDFLSPDFVVIGTNNKTALSVLRKVYVRLLKNGAPILDTNLVNAELAKLALNCYINVKMTFSNYLAMLCESVPGGHVDEVTRIIGADKRVGRGYLQAAMAYGGPCFCRDGPAMVQTAIHHGTRAPLIGYVHQLNEARFERAFQMIVQELDEEEDKSVAVLSLAYKPGLADATRSVGRYVCRKLRTWNNVGRLRVYDPLLKVGESLDTAQACVDECRVIVLTQPLPEYGELQFRPNQVVIDFWRVLDPHKVRDAGAIYKGVGVYETP